MTVQQHGLILLIKSALTGQAYVLPKDFDLTDAFKTAANHVITTLVYYGAYNCGVDTSSALMCDNLQRVYTSIMVGERQDAEIKRVIEAFDNHAIEHMALKGVHLKKMYPKPEMRKMGDADILIQYSEYEKIRNVMLELGFTEGIESDHEFCWTKGPVLIELHKRLIPSYNKDYYAYFGDGWKLAKIRNDSGFGYIMTDEDQMIYLFTHFAKHYRDSGIGIRHMVDLWVYRRNHPSLDEDYIRAELEKLHLLEFYTNIIKA